MGKNKNQTSAGSLRHEQSQLLFSNDDFRIREAYKALRTNVMFSLTDEEKSHVLMVTSSTPNEGKSTTAVNLAISLAEAGKRTLVIDCDMRKPKLARLLKVVSADGLSNALFSRDDYASSIAHVDGYELYVMPAGSIPPNPSELLGSNRMRTLLDNLKKEFEYIILDTPPINVVTDAAALSPYADGVLLVVRSGVAERNAVVRSVDQLKKVNARLLGFILNGVSEKNDVYSSSASYQYQTDEE